VVLGNDNLFKLSGTEPSTFRLALLDRKVGSNVRVIVCSLIACCQENAFSGGSRRSTAPAHLLALLAVGRLTSRA
jgi:hypothetical protein